MSRSYKKNPYLKDYNKGSKQLAHRRYRRYEKIRIKKFIKNREEDINFFSYNEINNPWEICDYKFYYQMWNNCTNIEYKIFNSGRSRIRYFTCLRSFFKNRSNEETFYDFLKYIRK